MADFRPHVIHELRAVYLYIIVKRYATIFDSRLSMQLMVARSFICNFWLQKHKSNDPRPLLYTVASGQHVYIRDERFDSRCQHSHGFRPFYRCMRHSGWGP